MPARVLLADPPWKFGDTLPGKGRGAGKHYRCMSVQEIMRFPLPPLADDALLLLWRVAAMQQEALKVIDAWGFTLKSEIVWVKTKSVPRVGWPSLSILRMGMGRAVRNAHEVCLLCTRGRPVIRDHSVLSVIFAPRGLHSAKPVAIYDRAQRLSKGPYVELFARHRRVGWVQQGLELSNIAVAAAG